MKTALRAVGNYIGVRLRWKRPRASRANVVRRDGPYVVIDETHIWTAAEAQAIAEAALDAMTFDRFYLSTWIYADDDKDGTE